MALDVSGSKSLYWKTGLDNSGLYSGSLQAKGIIAGLARNVSKADVFAGLAIGAVLAFDKIKDEAYEFSKEFEHSMKEVQTISSAVANDFKGMSDEIVGLSRDLPESANGLAKAFYQVVSAGYDGAAGMEVLEVAAKGAVAGVTDTLTAVDGLTTILNAFHMEAIDAAKVSDIMFTTIRLGKTTLSELSSSFNVVAPLAAAMGIEFEQVSAAVATLTKQGTPTAEAMTQIRSAILSMDKVLGDGWADTMTLQEAMIALRDAADKSDGSLRELVGRVEAVNAVLGTTGENAKMAASDLEAHNKSLGAASAAYKTMAEDATTQINILKNNVMATLKPLGDFVLGVTTKVAKMLNRIFDGPITDLQRLARSYEGLQGAMSNRERLLEDMLSVYEKAVEGTDDFQAAEKSLASFLNTTMGSSLDSVTSKTELLAFAKQSIMDIDKEQLELQRALTQIQAAQYDLEIAQAEAGRSETAKRLQEARDYLEEMTKIKKRMAEGSIERIQTFGATEGEEKAGEYVDEMISRYKNLGVEIDGLEGKFRNLAAGKLTDQEIMGLQNEMYEQLTEKSGEFQEALTGVGLAEQALSLEIKSLGINADGARKKVEDITEALKNLGVVVKENVAAQEKSAGFILNADDLEDELAHFKKVYKEYANATKAFGYEEAERLYPDLQSYGVDYQMFLNNMLAAYSENAEARKIIEIELAQIIITEAEKTARKKEQITREAIDTMRENAREIAAASNREKREEEREREKTIADIIEKTRKITRELSEMFDDVVGMVAIFDESLSQSLSKSLTSIGKMYKGLNKISDAEFDLASGGYTTGGIMSIMSGGVGLFAGLYSLADMWVNAGAGVETYSKSGERLNAMIEETNELFADQQTLIDSLYGQEQLQAMKDYYAELGQDLKEYQAALRGISRASGGSRGTLGDLRRDRDRLEELEQIADKTKEIKAEMAELEESIKLALTGTTSESIADSIADGFSQGLDSAEVFAKTFEGLMRQALENNFKRELISKYLNPWNEKFAEYAEDGLSPEDIFALDILLKSILPEAGKAYEAWDKLLDEYDIGEADNASGLAGAMAGITEETAGLLEGQFRAVKINTAETNIHMSDMLDIMDNILLINSQIADNTKPIKNIERLLATQGRPNTSTRATGVQ